MLQGCLRMITTALQQLTIFIARLTVQVYNGEQVVEKCALLTQAEFYWFHSQPSHSSNWRAETCVSRKSTSPCLLGILAFDPKGGLNNRHLKSNRGICLS
jgi:hypothetical protein